MDNNIECYYWDDWIKVENENPFLIEETENGFINIKFYPLKINKDILYKIVYYDDNNNKIHDIKQCCIDIPRYCGHIKLDKLIKFNLGHFTYESLLDELNKYYNDTQIIDILNFIPQQIFIIIMNEILNNWNGCYITKTTHQLNIENDHVERILEGELYKNEIFIKKFLSKLKLYYKDNYAVLLVTYF